MNCGNVGGGREGGRGVEDEGVGSSWYCLFKRFMTGSAQKTNKQSVNLWLTHGT